jgi:hypothetical protein
MPQQPDLFTSSTDGRSAVTPGHAPEPLKPVVRKRTAGEKFGRALFAAEFLLAIMVRIFIGVIVFVIPWSPLWDNNHFLQEFPILAQFFSYGAVRGVISGIGLLNLWVAVDDTLHRSQRHI